MSKLTSLQFNPNAKLTTAQSLSFKGGDDKRGDRPGGGSQGLTANTNQTTTTNGSNSQPNSNNKGGN